jgi:hypothetical protein
LDTVKEIVACFIPAIIFNIIEIKLSRTESWADQRNEVNDTNPNPKIFAAGSR